MSAGGRALAQSIGQFGNSFQQMGETIYKVEADNEFRNQSLLIADGLEKFNTSLLTDPDHGTPGSNEGYMKKWEEYKRNIDGQIQKVKNPLAKKNLENYVTQVATKQRTSIYSLQFDGWSKQMVSDAETRISTVLAQAGVPTQFKLDTITEELESLRSKNIIDPGAYSEIKTKYMKQVISSEFLKNVMEKFNTHGKISAMDYIKNQGFEYYKVGEDYYSVTEADINKSLSFVETYGSEAGNKEYTKLYDRLLSGQASESEYQSFLNSENPSYTQKTQIAQLYYGNLGDSEAVEAMIGVGRLLAFSKGEKVTGQFPTWADIESMARSKKIDSGTFSHLQSQFLLAKDNIRKLSEDAGWTGLMIDIVDGKVPDLTTAINRGAGIGKAEEARNFFLQTQDRASQNLEITTNNDATDQLAIFEDKIRNNTATRGDFDGIKTWLDTNKNNLGSGYSSAYSKAQSLEWKRVDQVSNYTSKTLEQKIRSDPALVSDSDIWGKDISPEDSRYLSGLKLQFKKEADLTDQDIATKEIANKYSVNEKLKRGETLKDGENIFTRKDLEGMIGRLPSGVYTKYSEQLDRDEADNSGMSEYWSTVEKIDSGTITQADIHNNKKLPFNMQVDLERRLASSSSDKEYKEVTLWSLNLVKQLNGESFEGKALSYQDLKAIKSPEAHKAAANALAQAVEFQKSKGKGEKYLSVFKEIVEGKVTSGIDILGKKSLEPDQAIELYSFFMTSADKNNLSEQDKNALAVHEKYKAAKATAMGTLKEGQEKVTIEQLKEFIAQFDETGLPLSVRKAYDELADGLDSTTAAERLSKSIRTKGAAWVKAGAIGESELKAINEEIDAAPLSDKDGFRALVQTYASNAEAVARQKKDDEWTQSQRTRTAEQQANDDDRTARQNARKASKADLDIRFKNKLKVGMSEEEYLGLQAEAVEIFLEAPDEYASAWRLNEVLYLGKQDVEYGKKEGTLQDAFDELVSENTIEGYRATGNKLSLDLINKTFLSDSKSDLKGREYWTDKFNNFQKSEQANQVAKTNAATTLIEARTRTWDVVTGVAAYDPNAVYFSEELIKENYQYLDRGERDAFHNDLTLIAKATEAKAEAAKREAQGTTATAAEKAVGNAAFSTLEAMAEALKLQKRTTAAVPIKMSYTNKKGELITKTVTPEFFEEVLKEFSSDLILSGDFGNAYGLKTDFTSTVSDPIWDPVEKTIATLTDNGKNPQKVPSEVRHWIDQKIATTTKPDPKMIDDMAAQIKNNVIKINLSKTFDIMENRYDVSESYLDGVNNGKWKIFIQNNGKNSIPIHKEFEPILQSWASKTLSTTNAFATMGILKEGENASKEVFESGHVQYRVTDPKVLQSAGIAGEEAVFYLGFYEKDALPVVEVSTKSGSQTRAWIPWEKDKNAKDPGRWVNVEAYDSGDGAIRYRKTQDQLSYDKNNVQSVTQDSIAAVQNYPALN